MQRTKAQRGYGEPQALTLALNARCITRCSGNIEPTAVALGRLLLTFDSCMRSALFVDFDNVYSRLEQLSPGYAQAFARRPVEWVRWLSETLKLPSGAHDGSPRRILVRRCYLNPARYGEFRFAFSCAGFEIIDCPPMTQAGKTSTDIHLVLDVVDVLQDNTRFDEFIIFSADADFSPVLRKLRREDRRTTIFAAGATSPAYEASADLRIQPEEFIGAGLGFGDEDSPVITSVAVPADALTRAEDLVRRMVDDARGPVPIPALTKALALQIEGLADSQWAGRRTFGALLRSLSLAPLRIDGERGVVLDPRRLLEPEAPADAAAPAPEPAPRDAGISAFIQLMQQEVSAADRPVAVAQLAQMARDRVPGIEHHWFGHGSCKRLLEAVQIPGVVVVWPDKVGFALDPLRHAPPPAGSESPRLRPDDPRMAGLAPLLTAAGLPLLAPGRYGALLQALSEALQERPFNLSDVTRYARDVCNERHTPVRREQASTVMRTLLFNGFDPVRHPSAPLDLVTCACDVVMAACDRERLPAGDAERHALADWFSVGMADEAAGPPAGADAQPVA